MDLMLNEIEISNFLSYNHAKFEGLTNYNVLIGKNSSGKSNLFKILEMLKNNYENGSFRKDYLFEANEELQAKIELTFNLTKSIRKKLFKNLYRGNRLQNAFGASEGKEGCLKREEWNKEAIAVKWLLEKGYYCKAKVNISYIKENNGLIFTQIALIHQQLKTPQILYDSHCKNNNLESFILDLNRLGGIKNPLNSFFRDSHIVQDGFRQNDLGSIFKRDSFMKHLILGPILEHLSIFFFAGMHHIPDKRRFDSESDRNMINQTILNPNGSNLVKFIHKKIVMNEKEWIKQFNNDLKYFIPDIDELGQVVNARSDQAMLILKENNLDMELSVENMGSGILNMALFIAYIMELNENKILCIEEPELYLHPGLEMKLRQKFIEVSERIQIFITSHSREFLDDNEDRSSVHLIHKENNQSTVNLIPKNHFEEIYNELDIDIEKYKLQKSLIYNESFWVKFINKIINRTEDQLWDFKTVLDMWYGGPKNKEIKQVEFCEKVASFANSEGGIIIIGITDENPRKILGMEDLENKMKSIKNTLRKYINLAKSLTVLKEVVMLDTEGIDRHCLVLAIAQTKDPIEVRSLNKTYSYPIRIGPGLEKVEKSKILSAKQLISKDNFDFILNLKELVSD